MGFNKVQILSQPDFKRLIEEILPRLDGDLSLSRRIEMATQIFLHGISKSAAGAGDSLSQEELDYELDKIKKEAGY